MKLYFTRHGQTNANIAQANNRSDVSIDEPLNEMGLRQAAKLSEELKDVKFDAIITSPLKRAVQTAEVINQYHRLDIKEDESWQERKISSNVDPETWHSLFDFDMSIKIDGIEDLKSFFDRIYSAIENLQLKYRNNTILVVSHGGVQHALHAYASKSQLVGNMRVSPMGNGEFRVFDLSS